MSQRSITASLVVIAIVMSITTMASGATPASAAVGTISGTLRRADGTPFPDGRVTATSLDGSVTSGADTGPNGSYTVTVEPGTYCVSFGTSSDAPAATTYGGAANCRAGTTPVAVASGVAVGAIDAVLHLGLIAGTLRTAAGVPIDGARVAGELVTTNLFISTTTGNGGGFAIKDLLPGTYCLTASLQRIVPPVSPGTPRCSVDEFAVDVVADVTPTPLDIRVDTGSLPAGGISGVVRYLGLPAAGRPVSASGIDVPGYAQTVTAANGTYVLTGLDPGAYCVTVGGFTGSIAAGEVHRDQESCTTATPVVVAASAVPGVDFALAAGGRVGGVVTGPAGTPLSDIDVHVTSFDPGSGAWRTRATTDTNGRYLTDGLPGGRYCVRFVAAFGGWAPETFPDAAACDMGAVPVIVDRGVVATVDAQLSAGGSITGRITTPAGIDRTEVGVTAYGPGSVAFPGAVDAAGDYTIAHLPPGRYCLGVSTAQFSNLVSSLIGAVGDSCPVGGGTITVADGAPTTVNVTPQVGGSISGFAIGPTGRPLDRPDLTVGASDDDRFSFAGIDTTEADGSYLIRGVPPGRWCVKLSSDARGVGSVVHERATTCAGGTFVTVVADQHVGSVDLVAPAVGIVSGTLRVPAGTIPTEATIVVTPIGSTGGASTTSIGYLRTFGTSSVDFDVEAAPGAYCVTASLTTTTGTLTSRSAADVPDCRRSPATVTVRALEETVGVDITLRAPTFVSLAAPVRLMDTRAGEPTVDGAAAGQGAVVGGTVRELQVSGRGGIPSDASNAVLNVTAVGGSGPGFLTVFPCGTDRPTASNLNYTAGQVVPNAVVTRLGTGGKACIFAQNTVDVVVDVGGHLPLAGTYTALAQPVRLMDTRPGEPTIDGAAAGAGAIAAGTVRELQVTGRAGIPTATSGVVLNVTAIGGVAAGFLTVFPCDSARPTASNVNYTAGQVVPNTVVTALSATGSVCVYALSDVDVAIDVSGHMPNADSFDFLAAPARLMDSRSDGTTIDGQGAGSGPVVGGSVRELQVAGRGGIPANAAAVVVNVTAVAGLGAGFLTVFPCGAVRPTASSVNYIATAPTPNAVFTRLGTDGKVCIFAQSTVDVVVDIAGSFLA